jgi:hypothetical protein
MTPLAIVMRTVAMISRGLRWLASFVATTASWAVITVIAVYFSVVIHLQTHFARELVRRTLNRFVSHEVQGALWVGRIDVLQPWYAKVKHVRMIDPYGVKVASLDTAHVRIDLMALLHGVLHFSSIDGEGLQVYLIEALDGEPTFIKAFNPRTPSIPDGKPGLHVIVDHIRVHNGRARGTLLGESGLRAVNIHAHGRIEAYYSLEVKIFDGSLHVVEPYPLLGRVRDIQGVIDTDDHKGIRIQAHASTQGPHGAENAHVRVSYALAPAAPLDAEKLLDLQVDANPVTSQTLAKLGFEWAELLDTQAQGSFRLRGITDHLRMMAALRTSAGDVNIMGQIPTGSDTVLHATSPRLQMHRVFPQSPEVTLALDATLTLPDQPKDTHPSRVRYPSLLAKVEPFVWNQVYLPALTLSAEFRDDDVRIENVVATYLPDQLRASGVIEYEGMMQGRLRADIPAIEKDPTLRKNVQPFHGAVQADLEFRMDLATPEHAQYHGHVHARSVRLGSFHASDLHLRGVGRGVLHPVVRAELMGSQVLVGGYGLGNVDIQATGGPHTYNVSAEVRAPGRRNLFADAAFKRTKQAIVMQAERVDVTVGAKRWRGAARDVSLSPTQYTVGSVQLQSLDRSESVQAQGFYRAPHSFDVRAQMTHVDVALLQALWGPDASPLYGHVDGTCSLQGDRPHPRFEGDVRLHRGRYHELGAFEAHAAWRYAWEDGRGRLQATGELLTSREGSATATLSGALPQAAHESDWAASARNGVYQGSLRLHKLDLALARRIRLHTLGDASGLVSGLVQAQGSVDDPTLTASVVIDGFGLPEWTPTQITSQVTYTKRAIEITQWTVADAHGLLMQAHGEADLDAYAAMRNPTQGLAQLAHVPWTVQLLVPPRNATTYPRPLRSWVASPIRVSASLLAANKRLGGTGATGQARDNDHSGHTDRIDHADPVWSVQGKLVSSLEWLTDMPTSMCGAHTSPTLNLQADLTSERLQADARVVSDGKTIATVAARAVMPVAAWLKTARIVEPPAVDVDVKLRQATVDELPWLCEYGSGPIEGFATVRGLFTRDPEIDAVVQSRSLQFSYPYDPTHTSRTYPFRLRAVIRSRSEHRLRVSALINRVEEPGATTRCGDLIAEIPIDATLRSAQCGDLPKPGDRDICMYGTVPVQWNADGWRPALASDEPMTMSAEFHSSILEPLAAWAPEITEADAIGNGRVNLVRKNGVTELRGKLDIDHGCAQVIGLGSNFQQIQGTLLLRNNTIIIDPKNPLQLRDETGSLEVHGPTKFKNVYPESMDLHMEANRFPIRSDGVSFATLSGAGQFRAKFLQERMDSKLVLERLSIQLPDQGQKTLQTLTAHPDIVVVGERADDVVSEKPYALHVMLDATNPLWVQRNDFSAQVRGVLDTVYLSPALFVKGYIELRRGFFEFFGKRLEIQRGSLQFDGQPDMNPVVDMQATYVPQGQRGDTVTVTVSGRLNSPNVEFTCANPTITDKAEIIALLVTGRRSSSQAGGKTLGDERSAQQQASSFFAGLTAGLLTLGARRQLGDVVPVLVIESGQSGLQGARVRAGWQLDTLLQKHFKPLRHIVRGAYIEGFAAGAVSGTDPAQQSQLRQGNSGVVGGLLELYFPYSIVGTTTFSPPDTWGVDVTWEP